MFHVKKIPINNNQSKRIYGIMKISSDYNQCIKQPINVFIFTVNEFKILHVHADNDSI